MRVPLIFLISGIVISGRAVLGILRSDVETIPVMGVAADRRYRALRSSGKSERLGGAHGQNV
jgi:hypothetical protein